MRLGNSLVVAVGAAGILALAVPAHATTIDFITGYGWITTEAIANSATGGSAASLNLATCHNGASTCTTANADVIFTTTGVSFNTTGSTIAQWLASSLFPINNLVDLSPSHLMDATIWEFVGNGTFTGTVATPQTFTIAHDDGATFIVNGQTVINHPEPTAPVTTTGSYTGGAGGNLPFQLVYTECCGGPAVLQTSLLGPSAAPTATPEPTSLVLMGTGLFSAGVRRWRKRRTIA